MQKLSKLQLLQVFWTEALTGDVLLKGEIRENGQWASRPEDRRCRQASLQTALDWG